MFLVIHRLKDFFTVKASKIKHQEYDDDDDDEGAQAKGEDSEKLAADRDDDDGDGAKTAAIDANAAAADDDDDDGASTNRKKMKAVTDPDKVRVDYFMRSAQFI